MALDAALEAAAKQGTTVLAAAGDNGVTDGVSDGRPHVDFPAASQWVLAVGGTSLVSKDGQIQFERVWNSGSRGGATGGGISEVFALPDWQNDVGVPLREDGSRGRGIPDVAASGDPAQGYRVRVDGVETIIGGTTAPVPLWAGLIALLNQGLGRQGMGRNIGYLNPRLYKELGPAGLMHPITEGDNGDGTLPGYRAGPGWNAVAGWGSPDGTKLLAWLHTHPG